MSRIAVQGLLLLVLSASLALLMSGFMVSDEVGESDSVVAPPDREPSGRAVVHMVEGRPSIRFPGSRLQSAVAQIDLAVGTSVEWPTELNARDGLIGWRAEGDAGQGSRELPERLELLQLDEEGRLWVTSHGLLLSAGRLQVKSWRPRRVVLGDSGIELEGQSFSVWIGPERTLLVSFETLAIRGHSRLEGLDPGSTAWLTSDEAMVARIPPQLVVERAGGRLRTTPFVFGFQRSDGQVVRAAIGADGFIEGQGAVIARDPLGRWAVPGRPSRSVAAVAQTFPSARDRAVLARLGDVAESVDGNADREKASPRPRRREGASGRARADGAPQGSDPSTRAQRTPRTPSPRDGSSEGAERRVEGGADRGRARRTQDPPDSLKVDWTKIGRPDGSVLEGTKEETPVEGPR
ncbi:MAG: hypothetical protein ACFB9M_05175 [Myxococcota bacterium]